MSWIALSGWGQPYDALLNIAPNAQHVNYARENSVTAALEAIAAASKNADMVIGWSLGGQMAVRAVAAKMLRPRRLVLIAAPFQFVERPELSLGMKRDLYDKFRDNYARNPQRTLQKSWELIIKGDANADQVRAHLTGQDASHALVNDWLHWLDMLELYSCEGLDFSGFPPTLIMQGKQDAVVHKDQSQKFSRIIPHAELIEMEACGHAPHWHDPAFIKRAIDKHADV